MSIFRRLLPIFTAAFLTISPGYAQNNDDVFPPQVIDVQPTPGAEISENDPLIVTFNQAMQQGNTRLSFDPALNGQIEWLDHRTLAFIPQDEAWPRSRQYSVTVEGIAENGLTLDPYTFEIQTQRGLSVAYVTPVDGTEYLAYSWSTISVTFDRPVAALDSGTDRDTPPQPLTFSPDLPGSGRWVNNLLYEYTPLPDALDKANQYTVTVEAGLRAVDGTALEMPYTWTFHRPTPHGISIEAKPSAYPNSLWYPVQINSTFEVIYSAPMDKATAEAAFSLRRPRKVTFNEGPVYSDEGIPIDGTFSWNADGTRMTFQPTERLQYAADYLILLEPTIQNEDGVAITNERNERVFSTIPLPGVARTTPEHGGLIEPGTQSVNFGFYSTINMETLPNRYRVEPQPNGDITPSVHKNGTFSLKFDHELGQTYTVKLLPGIEDIFGTPMKEPYSFTYHVGEKMTDNRVMVRLNSEFSLLNEGQPNPTVPLMFWGSPDVTLDVYRIDIDALLSLNYINWDNQHQYMSYRDSLYYYDQSVREGYWYRTERKKRAIPWVKPENRVFSTRHSYRGDATPLPLSNGEPLPLGLYGVELGWFGVVSPELGKTGFVLAVTNAAITLRNTPDSWLAWVTDLDTGEPLPGLPVSLYKGRDTVLSSTTDADGVARWPLNALESGEHAYVVVEGEGVFGAWQGITPSEKNKKTITHLYTDRTVYRPGETVYFRGLLRDKDDVTYTVPTVKTLYATILPPLYRINHAADSLRYSQQLTVTDFGGFSGEIQLPADTLSVRKGIEVSDCPPHDEQCIPTYSAYTYFSVADYRVPDYDISVIPQRDQTLSGEALNTTLEIADYSGAPADNTEVSWWLYRYGYAPWDPDQDYADYHFFAETSPNETYSHTPSETVQTDAEGRYLIDTPFVHNASRPIRVRINAYITSTGDQAINGQAISRYSDVTVHPANLYVGLRPQQTRTEVGQPIAVDVVTLDPQSAIRPNQTVALTVHEVRWTQEDDGYGGYKWTREEVPVTQAQVMTGADGETVYRFTPPGAGQYRVRARASDEAERVAGSSIDVYVRGADEGSQEQIDSWYGEPFYFTGDQCDTTVKRWLRLTPDKTSYKPGDTAYVFIPNPFDIPVSAMITADRDSIQSLEVVRIEGAGLTYSLPITEDHAPNVYVSATLIHGIGGQQTAPGYIEGRVSLAVESVHRRLNIAVPPSAKAAAPGDTVTFNLTVTDYLGNPVSAELGLSLVDEAALSLSTPHQSTPTLEMTYYNGVQPLGVTTSSAIYALFSTPLTEYLSGPCGRHAPFDGFTTSRGDYQTTPLWEPHVVTDQNGHASVSVVIPSGLTRWQFDAYAITGDTKVGQAQVSIISTPPLAVHLPTPRFLAAGDRLSLSAVVQNNTDAPQTVDVTLTVEGVTVMQPENLMQTVEIAPHRRAVVVWPVTVEDSPHVDVTVSAESRSGLRDAAKPPLGLIPVMRYTVRDTMATGGLLTKAGTITEGVSIPPRFEDATGTLKVDLDASLTTTIADGLMALWETRMGGDNLELVISRLYPELVLYNAGRRLGLAVEGQAQFTTALNDAHDRLEREQLSEGGWDWWSQMHSDPNVTAYVLLGLSEAQDAQFTVNPDLLNDALDYLRGQIITPKIDTPPGELDRQAFFLYVLARHETAAEAQLNALFEHRLELSWAARAYLLMAYHLTALDSATIPTLVSDLTSAAVFTATGAHWEETRGGYNWGSDTHTTAVVLAALMQTEPENVLAPHAVRWLVATRRGDLWRTAQENAWALVALTGWMAYTGELDGDFTYFVSTNNVERLAVEVTPETVDEGETFTVPVAELLDREINRLDITRGEGDGALYYSALLDLHLPAEQVEAVNRGVSVTRQYSIDSARDAQTSAQVGDVVTVRLSLYVSENIYYFALEDTLPAGLEVINTSLLTELQSRYHSRFQRIDRTDHYWYFGDSYFTRTAIRDKGVALYAAYLPRGAYTFTYQARAVTPGEFQVIPAQGYAVYQPDVFGHTDGLTFTVLPKMK